MDLTKENVENVLNNYRPQLQADGGDMEFVKLESGRVYIRLTGACGGCPMATMTLKMGVEQYLKEQIPTVVSVEQVY